MKTFIRWVHLCILAALCTLTSLNATAAVLDVIRGFECGIGDPAGCAPGGVPAVDSAGRIYGHNTKSATYESNVLFRTSMDGTTEILHLFSRNDLGEPSGPLYIDENDNVYGVLAGVSKQVGGAVYKREPNGNMTVLRMPTPSLQCTSVAGAGSGLIRAPDGKFYGSTFSGGKYRHGSIFSVDAAFTTVTEIYSFSDRKQGTCPSGPLLWSNGRLHGVAAWGGPREIGTLFSLNVDGSDFRSQGMVHGSSPSYGLTSDGLGNIWGGSFSRAVRPRELNFNRLGILFRIDSTGKAEIVHRFSLEEGLNLNSRLVLGLDGKLYGTSLRTGDGGKNNCRECGSIWRIDPQTFEFEVLHTMRYLEGAGINGLIMDGKTGRFYGLASLKGPSSPMNPEYPTRPNSEDNAGSLFTFLPRAK